MSRPAHRPRSPDPRCEKITTNLTKSERAELTVARGDTPEAVYVRQATLDKVRANEDPAATIRKLRAEVERLERQLAGIREVIL